jgi:hypothetical protein
MINYYKVSIGCIIKLVKKNYFLCNKFLGFWEPEWHITVFLPRASPCCRRAKMRVFAHFALANVISQWI